MAKATYVLEVDWTGAGDFSGDDDDITEDFLTIETRRGRDYASQLTGRATAGRLIAMLINTNGKYSSFNSSSPIFGNIVPKRKVRLRTTSPVAKILWTGWLDRIRPAGNAGSIPTVTLEATGSIGILSKDVTPPAQESATTGEIIGAILDDAGWSETARDIDTGQTTIERWNEDKLHALTAIRRIEETELGFFYEDESGNLVFEDRHARLKSPQTTPQATFADDGTGDCTYRSITQQDPLREIYNDIYAIVSPLVVGSAKVLWTLQGETPQIGPGQSATYWTQYPNSAVDPTTGAYVDAWTTPVVGTDITQTGVSNGDIAINVEKFANSMKITITNNHATNSATITLLQARGTPVTKTDPVKVAVSDATSQADYGVRTYQLPGPWLPDTEVAQDFVQYVLSRYKDPLPVLSMTILANKDSDSIEQALTRQISDRVTVVATGSQTQMGIDDDFFVEAISHRITQAGHRHEVTFELSDASGDAGYWVVGVSALGIDTKLAY